MQFLYFLVLLPVHLPAVFEGFVGFFEVSTGNLDLITSYIPKVPQVIINPAELPKDHVVLYEKFSERWIDNPYLGINYGSILLLLLSTVFIVVPAVVWINEHIRW